MTSPNSDLKKSRQIKRAVYLMAFYVLAQFTWWTYLLIQQSASIYGSDASRRIAMILGEGSIFLILVILGFRYILKAIQKEQTFLTDKQNFLLSVTHELKSPIAALKLALQTLLKSSDIKDENRFLYQTSLDQTERLNKLVNNILITSSLDQHGFQKHIQTIELSSLLNSIIDEITRSYTKDKTLVQLFCSINTIQSDLQALHSIFYNLIENAVKYSPLDAHINVSINQTVNGFEFKIQDLGEGIPDHEKQRVFELFYRVGHEHNRRKPGTGLGLYIVQRMIHELGGQIQVLDNSPKGTIFKGVLHEG